jgi:riboflavin kinase/FMN adenylyltransferase
VIVARTREELRDLRGPCALCIGVFDGVHRGHAAMIAALRREAEGAGAASLVVTLHPNPSEVLRPDAAPPVLTSPAERVELLARHAPDAVFVYPFDRATAALAPEAFLESARPPEGTLAVLVVGYDFRMGRGRAAGYEELRAIGAARGFRVARVGPEGGEEPISSTRIRSLIAEGRVAEANELLGHRYLVRGTVVRGRGVGRTLDFPTANVDVGETRKLLPRLGVYAVLVRIAGEPGPPRAGVMNRGVRPTFGGTDPTLEVHLPGYRGDLVGLEIGVEIVERIRDERAFDGPEALAARIEEDVREARKILENRQI